MKKWIAAFALLLVLVVGAFAWYRYIRVETPKEAWLRATSAAMLGDEQTFLAAFTDQSRLRRFTWG